MSFILDALKKAEKERNRGRVPDLLTIHEPVVHKPEKRSVLFYLLIGLLLINAAVFVWLFNTRNINKSSSVFHSSDETAIESKPTASSLSNIAKIDKQNIQTISEKSTPESTITSDIKEQNTIIAHIPDESNLISIENPMPEKIYSINELPLSIQQKLPAFDISVVLYSDNPTSRMARINGKTLREGQSVTEKIHLEEIKPDSVILSYQKYHFCIQL